MIGGFVAVIKITVGKMRLVLVLMLSYDDETLSYGLTNACNTVMDNELHIGCCGWRICAIVIGYCYDCIVMACEINVDSWKL